MGNVYKWNFAALVLSTAFLVPLSAAMAGNEPAPQVSVINLQVVKNERGGQSVITPKGDLAALPGAGVAGNVAQIFFGSQGGFWYTDQTGQTIDLYPTVQELQARRAQQVPQYAPVYDNSYQDSTTQQSSQSSGNSGVGSVAAGLGSAVVTGAAAAGGAALGAAMTHGYYNVPYGTPMYYGNHGNPYYYHDGERREFEDLNQNQKMAIYNKRKLENQQREDALAQRQTSKQANQDARQAQFNNRENHHQNFQRQQDWYQNQLKENSHNWKRQGDNPFASQNFSRDSFSRGERGGGSLRQSGERFGGGGREFRGGGRGGSRGFSSGGGRLGGGGGGGRRGR